jgi:BASS family bile acid:Na+ symporter
MDLATLLPILLRASVFLLVFALALGASFDEALYVFRRPAQFVRSLLAMAIVMPLVAVTLAAAFDLAYAVKLTLIALAVSPVPPILPMKQIKAGGSESYTVGLLFAAALLSIVTVPVIVEMAGRLFDTPAHVPFSAVALIVFVTVIAPLLAGMAVRFFAPAFAQRIARPLSSLALVTLLIGVAPIVYVAFPAAVTLFGNGTVAAFAVFVVAGIATGHLLGGPELENRVVLALATATRHPGIAMAVAHFVAPTEKLVLGAVLWYLIAGLAVSAVYLAWCRRRRRIGTVGIGTER